MSVLQLWYSYVHRDGKVVFEPGLCMPGFLKLFLCEHMYVCISVCVCVCVCVCMSSPKAINNQWHDVA